MKTQHGIGSILDQHVFSKNLVKSTVLKLQKWDTPQNKSQLASRREGGDHILERQHCHLWHLLSTPPTIFDGVIYVSEKTSDKEMTDEEDITRLCLLPHQRLLEFPLQQTRALNGSYKGMDEVWLETFGRLALFAGLAALYRSCRFSDLSSSKKILKMFSGSKKQCTEGQFESWTVWKSSL